MTCPSCLTLRYIRSKHVGITKPEPVVMETPEWLEHALQQLTSPRLDYTMILDPPGE